MPLSEELLEDSASKGLLDFLLFCEICEGLLEFTGKGGLEAIADGRGFEPSDDDGCREVEVGVLGGVGGK
mgnify:FL=1